MKRYKKIYAAMFYVIIFNCNYRRETEAANKMWKELEIVLRDTNIKRHKEVIVRKLELM